MLVLLCDGAVCCCSLVNADNDDDDDDDDDADVLLFSEAERLFPVQHRSSATHHPSAVPSRQMSVTPIDSNNNTDPARTPSPVLAHRVRGQGRMSPESNHVSDWFTTTHVYASISHQ